MVSKASQIVLLCEDKLHEVTVRRFLCKRGANLRNIRTLPYPKGGGSGEQFVRKNYVDQLKAFRKRSARAQTLLVVVIDADAGSVTEHHQELDEQCKKEGIAPRKNNEAVVHFIPKWHIETWLAYLSGETVNETDSYKKGYSFSKKERDAKVLVDRLCSDFSPSDKPPSLVAACGEWEARGKSFLSN